MKPQSRCLQGMLLAILLSALAVLPLGVAYAQTEEKKTTVKADKKQDKGAERAKIYLAQVKKDLDAAVAAGKITQEAADMKFKKATKGARRRLAAAGREKKPDARSDPWAGYGAAQKRLQVAVDAGKISQADADKRLSEYKKLLEAGKGDRRR